MIIDIGDISNLFLVITTVVAWVKYSKYKNSPLKYLPHYLSYAVFLEIGADLIIHEEELSYVWYNFGINIEILFYFFVYYHYLNNKNTKKFLLYSTIFYEIYFLLNVFFLESWWNYQSFPFTVGGILVIIIVFLFLLEMFQSNKVLHTKKYLIFWISLGLLFYNIIPLPLFVTRSFISECNLSQLMPIQYLANIIMYVLFIYGFIWSSMKYK